MSDTEANQPEENQAEVITHNEEIREVGEVVAVVLEHKEARDQVGDDEDTGEESSNQNKPTEETEQANEKQPESYPDEDTVAVVRDKSPIPEVENQLTTDNATPHDNQMNKPYERNREPSEELEYEPMLDDQTAEGDKERDSGRKTYTSVTTNDLSETTVSPRENEAPPDESVEEIPFQSVSDRRQMFETPIVPSTTPTPVLPAPEQPLSTPVKRQVSWEPGVETITVDQSKNTLEVDQSMPQVSAYNDWVPSTNPPSTPGRLVYGSVPSVNSKPSNQLIGQVTDQMATVSMNAGFPTPRRTKPYQSALYRRQPVNQQPSQPFYVRPNFCISPRSLPGTPSAESMQATVEPWNNYPNQSTPMTAPPPPPLSPPLPAHPIPIQQPAASSYQQYGPTVSRKISGTPPYVGSQVIATETGPSVTVSLRRPTSERHWGFTFFGGSENGCPPFVNKVTSGSLAAQHGIEVGDVIVSICNSLTVGKTQEQLKAEMLRAGNELDLVLIRRGVDLNKIAQLAPKALPTSPISPPPSSSGFQDRQFLFHGSVARTPHVEPIASRGRSFRTIKTKSIRLLEEQLASGQSPSSVIQTKQHYQGARGLPASGTPSTYMRAYGQNPSLGYLGRTTAGPGSINDPAWTGRETAVPIHSAQYARSVIAPNDSSYVNDIGAIPLDQSSMVQPTWETQSYSGQVSGWTMPATTYQPQPQQYFQPPPLNMSSPQAVVYPNPNYSPGSAYSVSTNISVPIHGRPQWPGQP